MTAGLHGSRQIEEEKTNVVNYTQVKWQDGGKGSRRSGYKYESGRKYRYISWVGMV